jgi:RNA recognition motif-containing protein
VRNEEDQQHLTTTSSHKAHNDHPLDDQLRTIHPLTISYEAFSQEPYIMSSPSSHAAYTFNEDVLVPSKLAADRPMPPGPRRMETRGKSAVGHDTAGSEGKTLWVGNLDIAVTKEQLQVIFHAYTV